ARIFSARLRSQAIPVPAPALGSMCRAPSAEREPKRHEPCFCLSLDRERHRSLHPPCQGSLRRSKQREAATRIIPVARHGSLRNRWTLAGVDRKEIAMKNVPRRRGLLLPLIAITAIFAGGGICRAQTNDGTSLSIELVDPKVLRVCADPHNLPFSNDKGEGIENKLGELFAEKLQKKLDYAYFPQATGFVRMTLAAHRCDVIMGFPQGDDLVQGTNPYYRTAYALVARQGSGLDEVATLGDGRLKGKHIGIVAGTPPANNMTVNGLMADAKPYPLVVDTRIESSAESMINDLTSGKIDAAILWGPLAGYYAKNANPPLHVTPLVKETTGPRLVYRIGMGVRPADQNWKRQLNGLIQENQPAINKILLDFGVPLLDENDRPIGAETATKSPRYGGLRVCALRQLGAHTTRHHRHR